MAGPVSAAPMAIGLAPHLMAAPVLLPLLAGALLAAVGGYSRTLSRGIGMVASVAHVLICVLLYMQIQGDVIHVYQMGNWPAPFGIVIVLDRLSALIVLLTSTLGLIGLLYANSAWSNEGRRFQALWQFQMMGLCGAFLTGDLFNLFVFFEVLLAASYALLLHGGGAQRVGSTFHFVVILVAVASVLLLTVFLIKAGLVPFHFWVPASFGSAAAPVVALIVAKVGAYSILRVYPLIFGDEIAPAGSAVASLSAMAQPWLFALSILTLLVGSIGALASRTLRQLAATLTLVSIGTLFVPVAVGAQESLAAASYYLVHSTIATATLFLIAEWVGTHRGELGDRLEPGPAIAHPLLIGGALLWALITSVGLPPTSGFIGKVLVLDSIANAKGASVMWIAVLVSSFFALIAVSRALSLLLWNNTGKPASVVEMAPAGLRGMNPPQEYLMAPIQKRDGHALGALLATVLVFALSIGLVVQAGPVLRQTAQLATQLKNRDAYIGAVLHDAKPLGDLVRPSPVNRVAPATEGVVK